MAGEDSAAGAARKGGVLGSVRNLAATAVAIVRTRLELLANEIQEEGLRLRQVAVLGLGALFFLALGVLLLTLLVIVAYWDEHRLLVIGALAAFYLALALMLGLAAQRRAAARPKLFEASLAELKKDRERLSA